MLFFLWSARWLAAALGLRTAYCPAYDVVLPQVRYSNPNPNTTPSKAGKLAAGGDAGVVLDAPGLLQTRLDLDLSTPRRGEA